jgi:hypothetical protein
MEPCIQEKRIQNLEGSLQRIDERQDKIFKSMFGSNGNPREGYVWKHEQFLQWFYGDEKTKTPGFFSEWAAIKKTGLDGAKAAIALLIASLSTGFCYVLWNLIKMAVEHGKL